MLRLFVPVLVLLPGLGLSQPPIVQPGAPGQPSRTISAEEAVALAGLRHSAADVRFMSDMIPHHQQALDMSALAPERSQSHELLDLARRIETSQRDEIEFMEQWLSERGEPVPDRDWRPHLAPPVDASQAHGDHGQHQHHRHHHHHQHQPHHGMEGMATIEQMEELAASSGEDFDRLFLALMIEHHRGALVMVEELLAQSGSAQDPALFEFVTDVKNDQAAEIDRMTLKLASYSADPRVGLAAGFRDAGEAIWNLRLTNSLPKPDGFFDPDNPAALPPARLRELAGADDDEATTNGEDDSVADDLPGDRARPALLDFANTDLAFAGDLMAVGSYHGFKLYDIADRDHPELLSAVVCPGGQGDVSIVGDLLILSVEQNRGRVDCGLKGVADKVSEERFRGLRIFDISDRSLPVQVGQVQTCRGSHTHTVAAGPDEDGRLIVYNSGISFVRDEDELEGCIDESPWRDEGTALFRIDVIEIPVDRPHEARIIHSPAVFADPDTGILAGLWERGDHGPGTQTSNETNHCHDITVFPDLNLAAGACSGNGILFDISDPINPERIDAVVDPGFAYWHSATFSNDGSTVIFTDEWGGGTRPRCRASDPLNWGANAIYDIVDNRLVFRSYYKMPAPQTEQENCVAHNGSLIPVPGRDIMVQAWYQGGISVFDFTDSANPVEIAFFDRGPIDAEALVTGGFWSAYWHGGRIYGTEIVRGLDVLALEASEHLSENEIAAALLAYDADEFNPQLQFRVSWPVSPVVARAYIDQLDRGDNLVESHREQSLALLSRLELGEPAPVEELLALAASIADQSALRSGITARRLAALAEVLERLARGTRG
ncbi:MAG: DUF305 domain-containing protein [Wenzhouxiangella sp.]|nr:DUF305 domain-containing protein [Wenzhouxiangella sp.]MCH8478015.1 DUF305 domain-containing protein [Wenzhouxiangella sp.]TVR96796.1 MAG: DUF305 domain-containing protein [Wenzhouxiangellaceae bacterium]